MRRRLRYAKLTRIQNGAIFILSNLKLSIFDCKKQRKILGFVVFNVDKWRSSGVCLLFAGEELRICRYGSEDIDARLSRLLPSGYARLGQCRQIHQFVQTQNGHVRPAGAHCWLQLRKGSQKHTVLEIRTETPNSCHSNRIIHRLSAPVLFSCILYTFMCRRLANGRGAEWL